MFFVYILEAEKSKRYYIGQTQNLLARVKQHNEGKSLSTKTYIPWQLKWWKEFESRSETIRMERILKSKKKRTLLEKFVVENNFSGCGAVGPVPLAERGSSKNQFRKRNDFSGLAH